MQWWIWCVLGMLLLVAELITPGGFYLMFFGIAGLAVGGLTFLDLSGPAWTQWLLFSAMSLISIAMLRKRLLAKFAQPSINDMDELVGALASAVDRIPTGATGRVMMRGTAWQARNEGDSVIESGQECRVEQVKGLMLNVRGR